MKIKLLSFFLLLIAIFTFQNCQNEDNSIKSESSITKILASDENKLVTGLDFLKSESFKDGRIAQTKIDGLLSDSVLRRVDKNTGVTNYSFAIDQNLPFSITNLVISESKGKYAAFFVDFINDSPKNGWKTSDFTGRVKLTSLDGKRIFESNSKKRTNKGGRIGVFECATETWTIYVVTPYGITAYTECETVCAESGVGGGSGGFSDGSSGSGNGGGFGIGGNGDEIDPGVIVVNDSGGQLAPDDEYTCPRNFSFASATTNKLWQEAALTRVYCNLYRTDLGGNSSSLLIRRVEIPELYFGLPYYNVEGNLVYNEEEAAVIATNALNFAERDMRERFRTNPSLTSSQLAQYWIERAQYHMGVESGNRGRISKTGSINPSNPIPTRAYDPCI
jgi:hypothetical protein